MRSCQVTIPFFRLPLDSSADEAWTGAAPWAPPGLDVVPDEAAAVRSAFDVVAFRRGTAVGEYVALRHVLSVRARLAAETPVPRANCIALRFCS